MSPLVSWLIVLGAIAGTVALVWGLVSLTIWLDGKEFDNE